MPYIIDGHNLIPHLGLNLADLDDEMALIERLRTFSRIKKKRVEVYFDGAPPGEDGTHKFGYITAHFVRLGRTADDAIAARLRRMEKKAKNWTVISSDREVLFHAKAARARTLTSETFANELIKAETEGFNNPDEEKKLSDTEIAQWMKIFSNSEK